jgi:putative hydrolase of the HAD superfamily
MWTVVSAVIFDFYGTLARWADTRASSFTTVFSAHGYTVDPAILDDYFCRYDGVEHADHSVSEEAYEAWVRARLHNLANDAGVDDVHVADVIEDLRATDQARMVAYPEAAATLAYLRAEGLAVGVCSNWGWELDAYLAQVGLLHLVDAAVTSARAGARKPHPGIYAHSARSLEVDPREVVFVGDSWEPDVRGPRRAGMAAVHIWREDERPGQSPPPLEPGDHRVEELTGVLAILGF